MLHSLHINPLPYTHIVSYVPIFSINVDCIQNLSNKDYFNMSSNVIFWKFLFQISEVPSMLSWTMLLIRLKIAKIHQQILTNVLRWKLNWTDSGCLIKRRIICRIAPQCFSPQGKTAKVRDPAILSERIHIAERISESSGMCNELQRGKSYHHNIVAEIWMEKGSVLANEVSRKHWTHVEESKKITSYHRALDN